jgi:DNA-directed RNA polymerase specialized sigma24 family protein
MLCHSQRACDTSILSPDPAQATRADAKVCCDAASTIQGSFTDVPVRGNPDGALCVVSEPRADITERPLLAAISRGSRFALRRLHSLYFSRLASFFMLLVPIPSAEIIDDLVADTMFDVWRMSASLGRGPSVHVGIMRIAWKRGSKHLACSEAHPSFPDRLSGRAESKTWLSTGNEALRSLSGVLATLHVNERAVVQLVHSGHSRQEVSDILSMPCHAIDAYLASAMIALHPWLAANDSSKSFLTATQRGTAVSRPTST